MLRMVVAAGMALGLVSVSLQMASAEPIRLTRITHIYGISADATDPAKVYLATERGYYVAGINGMADLLSADESPVLGFAPAPKSGGAIYSTGAEHQGIRVSIDNAKTWIAVGKPTAATPGPFLALDVSPANPKYLYGTAGMEVFRTQDGGVTWQGQSPAPGTPIDVAASVKDANTVFLATAKGLFGSKDGGKTWADAISTEIGKATTMVAATPDGSTYAFVAGVGLMKSADGVKWDTVAPANAFDGALLHFAVSSANGQLYAVTQFMKIIASTDGGKTWAAFAR